MDWESIAKMIATLSTGAAGLLTIQTLMRRMKAKPENRPLDRGERRSILGSLARLEQLSVDSAESDARQEARMEDFERRLNAVERANRLSRGQSTTGSTD